MPSSLDSNPCAHWAGLPDEGLTVDIVQQSLNAIQNDLWVTAACVDRLVNDVAVQRMILELGIERAQNAVECAKEAYGDDIHDDANESRGSQKTDTQTSHDSLVAHFRGVPAHAQVCRMRAVLLGRLDRLNTYMEICKEAPRKEEEEDDAVDEWNDDPWADGTAESSTISAAASPLEPPVALSTFLTDGLLRTSCLLASHQWFTALRVLFDRHGSYLWPYRFTVLDSIPEHAHPLQYHDILPGFDHRTDAEQAAASNPWRPESDWSERPEVWATVKESGVFLGAKLPLDSLKDEAKSHIEPLSGVDLSKWYKDRVDRIISSTGMVDMALATIQHGASQGVPDLDELGEELSFLSRLVYDTRQREDGDVDEDWTLARWNAMDPLSVVRAYLAHSIPDTLARDINRLVMPYLFVLEARTERAGNPDPVLPNRLLYGYILTTTLEMATAVFEASKPTLLPAQRLIRNDEDIARLALACLYGSDSLREWSTMSRIFECLPAWEIAGDEEDDENAADTTITSLGAFVTPSTTRPRCTAADLLVYFNPLPVTSLSRALDILDVHLESGEILARWNVPAPLRWFLQSSADVTEQRSWANRMARRAGGSEDKLETQSDWAWLLDDMLKLCGAGENGLKGAFGLLDRREVIHIFFSGLLSTGKFDIAQGLLHASKSKLSLDSKAVEDICLSCSREFYDNAGSGNYKFGDMKLAYQCLDLPPSSGRLLREKEFIEATSRLSSFNVMSHLGIPISPIEIRLTKDRLSLVSRVLSSNADAYKHIEVILELVRKLGFWGDVAAEVKTLAMLVETAVQAEDFTRAYETSEQMVDTILKLRSSAPLGIEGSKIQEASEVCWVACFQLGRQSEFDKVEKKLSLFGRALELCPPDKLHDVLTAWRRLEKEDIENRQERLSHHRSGTNAAIAPQPKRSVLAYTLAARLQEFHMPSPPLLNTPDAVALASRTFKSVAANFPFSVGGGGRPLGSQDEDGSSRGRLDGEDVSAQATRVFSKGIGWLIGDDS